MYTMTTIIRRLSLAFALALAFLLLRRLPRLGLFQEEGDLLVALASGHVQGSLAIGSLLTPVRRQIVEPRLQQYGHSERL